MFARHCGGADPSARSHAGSRSNSPTYSCPAYGRPHRVAFRNSSNGCANGYVAAAHRRITHGNERSFSIDYAPLCFWRQLQ